MVRLNNKLSLGGSFQVFLQHLSPLLSLSTFTALWLTILDFMDKYMHADKSDLLVSGLLLQYLLQESNTSEFLHMYKINSMYWVYKHFFNLKLEAIPESLKNMLLVMDTANIFHTSEGGESQLWKLTWDRIDTFLPHLKKELFKPKNSGDLIHYLFQFVTCFFVYCLHHVHFFINMLHISQYNKGPKCIKLLHLMKYQHFVQFNTIFMTDFVH